MPTYDYRCSACGHLFETMHSMSAPVLKKCPQCSKLKLVRLISGGAGVIFKGSGFYETDYKRNRRGADSSQEAKDDKGAKSEKAESKSDAKPETKTESKAEVKRDTKSDTKPKKDSGSKKD